MKRVVLAAGAMTAALAMIGVIACDTEASSASSSDRGRVAARLGVTTDASTSSTCTETEALALLRLQHLRALHLAFAMRDRLDDPQLRAFADRMVEDHMNLVHEIDTAMNDSTDPSTRRPDGGALSSSEDLRSLGEFTDRAVREIGEAKASEVEGIYVHHQVAEHMHAIGLIDNIIAPSVEHDGRAADLVKHGRELFSKHVRHLFQREAALAGTCRAEAVR